MESVRLDEVARIREVLARWPARELELATTRRLVRALSLLSRAASGDTAELLRDAARAHMREACRTALLRALDDRADVVAAEAVDAVLDIDPARAFATASRAFEAGRVDVLGAALEHVADHGLPEGDDEGEARERWFELLVRAASLDLEAGAVPAVACRALARVSGSGLDTLRYEEWEAWLDERRAAADGGARP
ncbi:MAG: hypothetical protein R3F34_01070 [Planctomycetota bacterium]